MPEGISVLSAPRMTFDDTSQNCFAAPPPAFTLTEQPVLELQIVFKVNTFEEFATQ